MEERVEPRAVRQPVEMAEKQLRGIGRNLGTAKLCDCKIQLSKSVTT